MKAQRPKPCSIQKAIRSRLVVSRKHGLDPWHRESGVASASAIARHQGRTLPPATHLPRHRERSVAPANALSRHRGRSVAPTTPLSRHRGRTVASATNLSRHRGRSVAGATTLSRQRGRALPPATMPSRSNESHFAGARRLPRKSAAVFTARDPRELIRTPLRTASTLPKNDKAPDSPASPRPRKIRRLLRTGNDVRLISRDPCHVQRRVLCPARPIFTAIVVSFRGETPLVPRSVRIGARGGKR